MQNLRDALFAIDIEADVYAKKNKNVCVTGRMPTEYPQLSSLIMGTSEGIYPIRTCSNDIKEMLSAQDYLWNSLKSLRAPVRWGNWDSPFAVAKRESRHFLTPLTDVATTQIALRKALRKPFLVEQSVIAKPEYYTIVCGRYKAADYEFNPTKDHLERGIMRYVNEWLSNLRKEVDDACTGLLRTYGPYSEREIATGTYRQDPCYFRKRKSYYCAAS